MSTGIRHFTSSAIVFNDQEQVLLVHHNKIGLWLYPGGHLEDNEDPAAAALRETFEETGITATITTSALFIHEAVTTHAPPWTIIEMPVNDSKIGPHHHIDMVYICRATSATITAQTAEVSKCDWFNIDQLDTLQTPAELPELVTQAATWAHTRT